MRARACVHACVRVCACVRAIVMCKESQTLGQNGSVRAEMVSVKLITEEVVQNRTDRAEALAKQKAGDCRSVGPVTLFPLGQ